METPYHQYSFILLNDIIVGFELSRYCPAEILFKNQISGNNTKYVLAQ